MKKILLSIFVFACYFSMAQNRSPLIGGPMLGGVDLRSAIIWLEVAPSVKKVEINYHAEGIMNKMRSQVYRGELGKDFNPLKFYLNGLDMNTTYYYNILLDGRPMTFPFPTKFRTRDLWQWRKPAPDFSFLTGSCAYFNERIYDRPGKPYGGDSTIFETMAGTGAAFHLWLGDNWYTREVDYSTPWGLNYRASLTRSLPVLQKFNASMPQYAIWDDHDYGPNDAGKSYILKEESRNLFMNYWCNPSYGEEGKGVYSMISYSDVDIFLTDDRFFRSEDEMPDSVKGQPNITKTYLGKMQMEWLKNALVFSKASFKIIATGGQVLNPYNNYEGMRHYSAEFIELTGFLAEQKIPGVIFFTGDRHFSEVIRLDRPGLFPLYDVTISPYTSGVSFVKGAELNNPLRVPGTLVQANNFGKVSVSGKINDRILKVEFIGTHGDKQGEWLVNEKELR